MQAEINLSGYGFQELPDDVTLSQDNRDIDLSSNMLMQIPSQIYTSWYFNPFSLI